MTSWLTLWQDWGTLLIGGLLLAICLLFVGRFVLPALQRDRALHLAAKRLGALAEQAAGSEHFTHCSEILATPVLGRLWREYAQTLHRSQERNARCRATTSAAHYFTEQALVENVKAFVDAVVKARPPGAKGTYLKRVAVTSTQGPGVKIDTASVSSAQAPA